MPCTMFSLITPLVSLVIDCFRYVSHELKIIRSSGRCSLFTSIQVVIPESLARGMVVKKWHSSRYKAGVSESCHDDMVLFHIVRHSLGVGCERVRLGLIESRSCSSWESMLPTFDNYRLEEDKYC